MLLRKGDYDAAIAGASGQMRTSPLRQFFTENRPSAFLDLPVNKIRQVVRDQAALQTAAHRIVVSFGLLSDRHAP
jgi:hypothetical protein